MRGWTRLRPSFKCDTQNRMAKAMKCSNEDGKSSFPNEKCQNTIARLRRPSNKCRFCFWRVIFHSEYIQTVEHETDNPCNRKAAEHAFDIR